MPQCLPQCPGNPEKAATVGLTPSGGEGTVYVVLSQHLRSLKSASLLFELIILPAKMLPNICYKKSYVHFSITMVS